MVTKLGRAQRARGFAIVISEKSSRGDKYNVDGTGLWKRRSSPQTGGRESRRLTFSCEARSARSGARGKSGEWLRPNRTMELEWNRRGNLGPDHREKPLRSRPPHIKGPGPTVSIRRDVLLSRVLNRMRQAMAGGMFRGESQS